MRTVHGVEPEAPIGPVLRRELWSHRAQGQSLSLAVLADRFQTMATHEGVPVEEIAERYQNEQVRPHHQSAGERLAALVVPEDDRPEWCEPDRLVRMVEPPQNGLLGDAYCWIVKDLDDSEYLLVRSHDGSEPMAWPVGDDDANLFAAMQETLTRVLAAKDRDRDDELPAYMSVYTQTMSVGDFLGASDSMHLV